MILTDYYKFIHFPGGKSGMRIDATQASKSYPPFEELRSKGKLFFYLGKNTYTKSGQEGKADLALTRTKHISSLYVPDVAEHPGLAYGDMRGTSDAFLFVLNNLTIADGKPTEMSTLEIFIARGQSKNIAGLFSLAADGELDGDMERLRNEAMPEGQADEAGLF